MPKWCDEGEYDALEKYLKTQTLYLGLYKVPTSEPAEDAVLADLTEPDLDDGYARIALAPADWTISGTNPTHGVQPQKIFTSSAPWGDVYGYFITNVEEGVVGKLIAVEQFDDGPYNVKVNGSVKVMPTVNCL